MSDVARPARHSSRSLPTTLAALVELVLGGLLAWVAGTRLATGHWPGSAAATLRTLGHEAAGGTTSAVAWAVLAVLGIGLLLTAVVPGSARRTELDSHGIPGTTLVTDADLERFVARRTARANGVRHSSARLRRGTVDVVVDSVIDDEARVQREVAEVCERTVADLRPVTEIRPRVRVHRAD